MPCAINMAKSFLILVALHIIYLIILRLKWIGNITPVPSGGLNFVDIGATIKYFYGLRLGGEGLGL